MNPRRLSDHQAIEARLGARLSSGLTEQAQQLPHDVGERLRAAREQAVARAAEVRRLAPQPRSAREVGIVGVTSGGMALMGATAPWWQRVVAMLPLLLLVSGLLLIERQGELEQVRAAAEVDAELLADDLPPDAYTDPGFAEFLREPAP